MSGRLLFALQRLSALVLAPLVLVHLGLIIYAMRGGLTAEEILSRTQGSLFWTWFYGIFVVAVSIHAPIGLATVLSEWTRLEDRHVRLISIGFAIVLLSLGSRAVYGVVA